RSRAHHGAARRGQKREYPALWPGKRTTARRQCQEKVWLKRQATSPSAPPVKVCNQLMTPTSRWPQPPPEGPGVMRHSRYSLPLSLTSIAATRSLEKSFFVTYSLSLLLDRISSHLCTSLRVGTSLLRTPARSCWGAGPCRHAASTSL